VLAGLRHGPVEIEINGVPARSRGVFARVFAKLKALFGKRDKRSVAASLRRAGNLPDAFTPVGCQTCFMHAGKLPSEQLPATVRIPPARAAEATFSRINPIRRKGMRRRPTQIHAPPLRPDRSRRAEVCDDTVDVFQGFASLRSLTAPDNTTVTDQQDFRSGRRPVNG
jgi:hypothetical protein